MGAYIYSHRGITLELTFANSGKPDGTKLQGWQAQNNNPNQQWSIQHRTTPKGP
jgi:hypothetical protein